MRNIKTTLLAAYIFLACAQFAVGAKGVIVKKSSDCDFFIVESVSGFAVLEWYGGHDPDLGDELIGPFESYGFKDIYNATADEEMRVWVEDYWLSEEDAIERYYDECQ